MNESPEQAPVDVAMSDVTDCGDRSGEILDRMDNGGSGRRRNAKADEKRVRNDSEGHAQSPVDHLRDEADEDERQEVRGTHACNVEHLLPGSPSVSRGIEGLAPDRASEKAFGTEFQRSSGLFGRPAYLGPTWLVGWGVTMLPGLFACLDSTRALVRRG